MTTEATDPAQVNPNRYPVGFSFAEPDRPYVARVAAELRTRGIFRFYDGDLESVVELWGKHTTETLVEYYRDRFSLVVVFISKHYVGDDEARLQCRAALERAKKDRTDYLLPARLDETPIDGLLSSVKSVMVGEQDPSTFANLVVMKLRHLGIHNPQESRRGQPPASADLELDRVVADEYTASAAATHRARLPGRHPVMGTTSARLVQPGSPEFVPEVRSRYGDLLGGMVARGALSSLPVCWDRAGLADLLGALEYHRLHGAVVDAQMLQALDVAAALCDAIGAKPVLTALEADRVTLGRLQQIYRGEVGMWPDGGSSDALLVEAAAAAIAERRRPGTVSLNALARFVLGIAYDRRASVDSAVLSEWLQSIGHQLADAQDHIDKRAKQAWLLVDLGDEPPRGSLWPRRISVIAHTEDDTFRDEEVCTPSKQGLQDALRRLFGRVALLHGNVLVDLSAPRGLLDRGIEHWPLVELDGEYEALSARCRPRLRWSKRLRDQRLRVLLEQRARGADWTADPAVVPAMAGRQNLEQWLRGCMRQPYLVAGRDGKASVDTLRIMLREGCAFVVWFPNGTDATAVEKTTAAATDVPAPARRAVLPDRLQDLDIKHFTIIWDDPGGREKFALPRVVPQGPVA
ncbi:TIR domain-containing protein [Frankia sp. CiP3]|uniref:TIR domain-containing protein n=1 Tax=Frankia sp. CiP3 TaxID=2880971 RepID=UPI001EF5B225|nr:TIR domain-containing protein [Frankia sp. CiP3]